MGMEWNRRNMILAVVLLALAFIPGGVVYVRTQGGLGFMMFRVEKWARGLYGGDVAMTPEEERMAKREAERIRKIIFKKYPSLRLEGKEVEPEQNGYLALFDLAKDSRIAELRKLEILNQLGEDEIDSEKLRKELEEFEELGKVIERVAALPERSNVIQGRIHAELIPSAEVKTMGDYLLMRARLEALDGNEDESFRYFELAVNLAEHVGDIDGPHLLSETVWVLMRLNHRSVFFRHILPALGSSVDLEKWRAILEPQQPVPQRLARLMKGEFNMMSEMSLYYFYELVPDPEDAALAYARWVEVSAERFEKMSLTEFISKTELPHEPFSKNLSQEGIALFGMMSFRGWMVGMIRSWIAEHQIAAALNLLIREQKGEDLSKLTETYLTNPVTGKPFGYDAASRTLTKTSAGGHHVDALKLPW